MRKFLKAFEEAEEAQDKLGEEVEALRVEAGRRSWALALTL